MKKSLLIYYYAVLLLMLCAWTSPSLPPSSVRLVYFVAVLLPLFKRKFTNYPAILSMFVILSANRYAASFMPVMPSYLIVATLVMLLGVRYKASVRPPLSLFPMLLVIICSDAFFSHTVGDLSYVLGLTILFFFFIDENLDIRRNEMSVSILVVVFILALESLIYGNNEATTDILMVDDMERMGWNDPNYFSHLLGMGALVALQLLVVNKDLSQTMRYILMGLLFLIVLVMLQVASRGGLVALGGAAVTLVLLSGKKDSNAGKILLILGLFVMAMYAMGVFDIMSARVENEDEAQLGGRSLVWAGKFVEFTQQAGPRDWVFGIGRERALALANYLTPGEVMGFHNDFLAVLLSYGFVGLLAFLFFLLYPLFKFRNPCVTSCIVFLILFSMSLEPFTGGWLDYCYFYFYLYILGTSFRYEDWQNQEMENLLPEEEVCTT